MPSTTTPTNAEIPAGVTAQVSYSGTPRGPDGTTTPDDYVRELANPTSRMAKFEEMGNDDAVQTGILARRQEICAANWQLTTEDTTPDGREILEFVENNLYPVLDDLLRLLGGGAMQYGFGAIEPVYQWSDRPLVSSISRGRVVRATKANDERIYIRKLAHIRQTSVESFKTAGANDPSGLLAGDLRSLEQHAYDGNTFRQRSVPADKLLLWVYNKQGDDNYGVPPTRACYKAWTIKQQIERLNLMHIDKFGVGTPVAEEGPGWSPADRDRLALYLKAWRSGAESFILHPNGGKITIVSDDGKTSMASLEWVKYYNLAVAKTFLTQQTELGSTETGARALGEVFYDQMGGIVQADCEAIANLLNNTLIVPLVRWNFGEREFYPTFAPSQRVRAGSGVASVLQQLITSKIIHPRPEDEAYFRDVFEFPSVELKVLQDEQAERDAQAAAIARQQQQQSRAEGEAQGGGAPGTEKRQPPVRIAAHQERRPRFALASPLADGAPAPATWGQTSYRTPEFSAWEHGVLVPDVLSRDLDLQTSRTTSEVHDVLRRIDEDLTDQVTRLASRGAAALSAGVRAIEVPDKLRKQLRAVLFAAAERARTYGGQAVRNEIERQLGPSAIGPQRSYPSFFARAVRTVIQLAEGEEPTPADLHLAAEVDRAVEAEIDRREQSARSAALTALAQAAGAVGAVLATVATTAAKAGLLDLSTGRTTDNVEGVVNVGFGVGRSETAQAIAGGSGAGDGGSRSGLRDASGKPVELVAKVYSAVMDYGTCNECAKWDGAVFPIDYPEDYTGVQAPNPRCAGTIARCRCAWIYITDLESAPVVPASKGPLPI